ncbi:MAG: GTP 3',8-cyclase MoaA [Paraclostridium sp.]|uniref:GTP 3',8-cyclase MoaA n=1 Tax=Paraclostridium sp. TaxID=2023273 RepID=UPI003EE58985
MIDSHNRNINYLRISITDSCNLRCKYCMPAIENNFRNEESLSCDEIYNIAKDLVDLGIDKIRITGGEPLARKDSLDIIRKIGRLDLKDFAITTNGILLKKYAKKLKEYGVKRVNISIDSFNPIKYKSITRGGNLQAVLEGINECKKVGLVPIKLNVVLIGGFNDDEINKFINLTIDEDIEVRFIELMPIGQVREWSLDKFISNHKIIEANQELINIEAEDISSPAIYYKIPNGKGKVGIINPISCKFCENCNRLRLTYDGKLKLCLHSNEEIDLRYAMDNNIDIKKIVLKSIKDKPKEHNLENGEYVERDMVRIGG